MIKDYLYEIEFWDHALEKGDKSDVYSLILCRARGKIIEIDFDKVVLQAWESLLADNEEYKDNQEVFVIARKLITEYSELIRWKVTKLT